jgi:hypothetical protein
MNQQIRPPQVAALLKSLNVPGLGARATELRKAETFTLLEQVCQKLEPTETQKQRAKDSYEAVGAWLAESDDPLISAAFIYAHGSTALGTTVKPIGRTEHDVDLVYHVPDLSASTRPAVLKKAVGDRLRANRLYAPILEEKLRCWRLNYAGEFHLDVTPSIVNAACANGGELVPDRELRDWKPSNPQGFRDLFTYRASLRPTYRLLEKSRAAADAQVEVAPFPAHSHVKGVLRRTVQLLKRHRDIFFEGQDQSLSPLSIIITTLASRSYEYCINNFEHDSEYDLLCNTIRLMHVFIDTEILGGRRYWFVWNETTAGENFAEKWNDEPARERAFRSWHAQAVADFDGLLGLEGLDELAKSLGTSLGERPVRAAMDERRATISAARAARSLAVAPVAGLVTSAARAATGVRPNTFYGEPE